MRIVYLEEPTQEWRDGLSAWQRAALAALHRQGRGLRDRTNHGSDYRWKQAGVKTRDSYGRWRRTSPDSRSAHQMIAIRRESFGFTIIFLRRDRVWLLGDDFVTVVEATGWAPLGHWYVCRDFSTNMRGKALAAGDPA